MVKIQNLPPEMLLLIFDYCDVFDLLRLSRTCKYFNGIISENNFWIKKSGKMLVTNQMSKRFRKRCNPLISSLRDKCVIAQHWQLCTRKIEYKIKLLHKVPSDGKRYFPYIQMTKDMLWWSDNDILRGFKRTEPCITKPDIIDNEKCLRRMRYQNFCYDPDNTSDIITKFILCKNNIISGHVSSCIKKWVIKNEKEEDGKKTKSLHLTRIYLDRSAAMLALDATSQNIISIHSQNNYSPNYRPHNCRLKIRRNMLDRDCTEYTAQLPFENLPYSLAIDPTETKLAVGYKYDDSINIFDINNAHSRLDEIYNLQTHRLYLGHERPETIDIVWENPYTLLTCNEDCINKWDLRAGQCVCSWNTLNKYKLQCISSDYQYTMMTGATYETVIMWDQRQRYCAAIIYDLPYLHALKYARSLSTPPPLRSRAIKDKENKVICSLQFDSTHLYAASLNRLYAFCLADVMNM